MSLHKLTADYIYDGNGQKMTNTIIVTDANGCILSMDNKSDHDPASIQEVSGIITPGFINTHCHLELSHMKGLVDTGTSLLPFLQSVVKFRDFPQEQIFDAIKQQDEEMHRNGIVAVGDICNKLDTAETKSKSNISYYSFVEHFDFMQASMTQMTINQYREVYDGQSIAGNNKKSLVPHAPYTVSPELLQYIANNNSDTDTVSIHNQETPAENLLFLEKSGGFLDFYKGFGFGLDHFKPTEKTAIHYPIQFLNPRNKTLFVHNTLTSKSDIEAADLWSDKVYWATCPNANLYIENSLPNYKNFIDSNAKMTIGTDSLTSNWQLCILEEMKTIQKYQSYVSFELLIQWATLNGAEALSYDDRLGSLEVGKTPGINQIICEMDSGGQPILNGAKLKKLI